MKEIIVNGVNVSECRYVVKYNNYCCDLHKDNCDYLEDCDFKKYKRLQKENEELKARRIKSLGFICDCEEREKYKQTLEEIREIAENSYSIPCGDGCYDCENCEDEITNNGETCMQYGIDKITNKINEVLNG